MSESISSLQNSRVKAAVKLRERRGRNQRGRFLIDGLREIGHALDAKFQIVQVFTCPTLWKSTEHQLWRDRLTQTGAEWLEVSLAVWEKLTFGNRREGILAVAETKLLGLSDLPAVPPQLVIVLNRIEKPGNLGAILRTADAVGASCVILADPQTDPFNPNAIRASLGTVFRVPLATADSQAVVDWLRDRSLQVCVARLDGTRLYHEVNWRQPSAVVLGSESKGVGQEWFAADFTGIQLPMRGAADSLNVSGTAAVILYEALRQSSAKN